MNMCKIAVTGVQTPTESHVYSKWIFRLPYDSFGVEHGCECLNCYKHAIPLGLVLPSKIGYVNNKILTPTESHVACK